MAQEQFVLHIFEGYTHLFEHYKIVIHQVASLVDEALAIAINGLDDAFGTLLTHLFGNGLYALDEQTCGVGAFGHLGMAATHKGRKRTYEALSGRGVKTSRGATVAGGAYGIGLDEQGVGIAVNVHVVNHEVVARGFALCPQLLASAAKKGDTPLALRLFKRLAVHVSQHQHTQCYSVLHHHGQQAVGAFVKFYVVPT